LSASSYRGRRRNLTRGDTENRKEGDANPFRGDVIVLELLAIVGAVRGTLRPFEVESRNPRQVEGEEKYALMTWTGIEFGALGALVLPT